MYVKILNKTRKGQMVSYNVMRELNQIAAQLLFPFNGLKERPEVARSKAREVVSLNDLYKDSRAVHQMLHAR